MINGRLSDDFIALTTKLMMAQERNEIIHLAAEFNSTIERLIEAEKRAPNAVNKMLPKSVTTTLKFTKQEISKMATTFKKEFIGNGLCARITKRESGKNSYCYEIRYRSNGYNISASSTDLTTAKKKFLAMTVPSEIEKYHIKKKETTVPVLFKSFALYYFEKFRKNRVAEKTYKNDLSRLNAHIIPAIGKMEVKEITPSDCQKLIDKLTGQEKFKTAVEIYNLLSCIFKNAYAHDLITKSPLDIVQKPTYDQENGVALSKKEETTLLNALNGSIFQFPVALGLFCGLRPNELKSAQVKGNFIVAVNSKRHSRKVEYKRIPISAMLKPYLLNGITEIPNENAIRKAFKNVLPNHKLYDLRTTFYSRCKECGVEMYALDEFMGHSLGKIGKAYTDLSDEYLLKEGKKLVY